VPPLSDEELAWQLMREEEAGLQARMLALAGVGAAGALGAAGGSEEDMDADASDGDAASAEDPDAMTYERLSALGEVAGVVPTGLPAAARAALPTAPYAGAEDEQCAVCRCEFEAGEEVAALPCRHFFHAPCICRWLEGKRTCPTCNHEIALEPAAAAAR
jgi:E3 ubiquitin-protein ligase BIG BROTHER-like protein